MSIENYKNIAENPNSTVVAKYTPTKKTATDYQSERELEEAFIKLLEANGYEKLPLNNNDDLVKNLREQLENLNDMKFSANEWSSFMNKYLANKNEGNKEKTAKIQEDYIFNLRRDDGTTKNVRILDKNNIHRNQVQIINQYQAEGVTKNRYDVTILVNGLPMVHIELKRRGVAIREAFNQINRYKNDSFWADSGLYEFVQLFVISNGTHTKYYSNTTRAESIDAQKNNKTGKKTSNSFEFTSWWADAANNRIEDLEDFTKTFFSKHSLLSILIKYCVFTSDQQLLVMRPFQIAASEKIIKRIAMYKNLKKLGVREAGGYIWHTTGSGKTLTSFKAARLASENKLGRVLFIVDRKDLDYQTIKEYDKFHKGAANSNANTKILQSQLEDQDAKIIITTIQKLSKFIANNKKHKVYSEHVVLIFDECHRSQFGDMHKAIVNAFKNYNIFGFTGTPILDDNAASGTNLKLKTTDQVFGDNLHTYTIVDAIKDENVLPFRLEYVRTDKHNEGVQDQKIQAIYEKKALNNPKRLEAITKYIIEHFDQKTSRNAGFYTLSRLQNVEEVAASKSYNEGIEEVRAQEQLKGFNSIFAVSSIDVAKQYYEEFKKQSPKFNIAIIYSFTPDEDQAPAGTIADESFDTSSLDKSSQEFLAAAIKDYNTTFGTSYSTSSDKFENYYKDISLRMKNREIDLLIVVGMFLTGFDATTLNTLWVDKDLRYHGLLQAFSRTNRVLNSVKTYGNIVSFRNLEQPTNEALALFGNKDASNIALLKSFIEYYEGWQKGNEAEKGYKTIINELQRDFPLGSSITGEQAEKDFIKNWGAVLRLRNILHSFDEFKDKQILSERELQDYQSKYLDLFTKYRPPNKKSNATDISDDIEFEVELVQQITVNIDYILQMVEKYKASAFKNDDLEISIKKIIDSDIYLRGKKELIQQFIAHLNAQSDVQHDWAQFVEQAKTKELAQLIKELKLDSEKTKKYIANAFRDGELKSTGNEFANILPPIDIFAKNDAAVNQKWQIYEKLSTFFEKYQRT